VWKRGRGRAGNQLRRGECHRTEGLSEKKERSRRGKNLSGGSRSLISHPVFANEITGMGNSLRATRLVHRTVGTRAAAKKHGKTGRNRHPTAKRCVRRRAFRRGNAARMSKRGTRADPASDDDKRLARDRLKSQVLSSRIGDLKREKSYRKGERWGEKCRHKKKQRSETGGSDGWEGNGPCALIQKTNQREKVLKSPGVQQTSSSRTDIGLRPPRGRAYHLGDSSRRGGGLPELAEFGD